MSSVVAFRRFNNALKKLDDRYMSITRFAENSVTEGISDARAEKYIYHLRTAVDNFGLDLQHPTTTNVRGVVRKIESSEYKPKTKVGFYQAIKKYFNTQNNGVDVSWIKTSVRKKDAKRLPKILSVDDLESIWAATRAIMDQALVGVAEELGPRPEEIKTLTVGDVAPDDNGVVVNLREGKTGPRRLRMLKNSMRLLLWVENHPLKENKSAPLWVYQKGGEVKKLVKPELRIERIGQRAGLSFHLSFYHFRHTCATEKANWMNEMQMRIFFGWESDSTMPAVYVHMSGRDVDKRLLEHYGLIEQEAGTKLRRCPRCNIINEALSSFCGRCGSPLSLEKALEIERVEDRLDVMQQLKSELKEELYQELIKKLEKREG